MALTVGVLGLAWYRQLRPAPAAADCCAVPAKRSVMQSTGFLASVNALAALLLAFACHGAKRYPTAKPNAPITSATGTAPIWQTRTYRIEGMTCEAGAHHGLQAVQQVTGVQAVGPSLTTKPRPRCATTASKPRPPRSKSPSMAPATTSRTPPANRHS